MSAGDESAEEEAWCANERDRVVAYLAAKDSTTEKWEGKDPGSRTASCSSLGC